VLLPVTVKDAAFPGRAASFLAARKGKFSSRKGMSPALVPVERRFDTENMGDFVIVNGDTLSVNFGATMIMPAGPQPLIGSSPDFLVKSSPVCLQGDEIPPSFQGALSYTEPPFTVPGTGTLDISPQTTTVLKNGGKALLLKGTVFDATFRVTSPAKTPPAPPADPDGTPDLVLTKSGTASFATSNTILTAS